MITLEQCDQAVEEFGNEAFRRFFFFDANKKPELFHCNDEIEECGLGYIECRTLPELFAHDVEVYGDNAYLMWDIDMRKNGEQPTCNKFVEVSIKYYANRKQSAALPFDLERAKRGEVVEFKPKYPFNSEWHTTKLSRVFDNGNIQIEHPAFNMLVLCVKDDGLRMKYPPKKDLS